MTNGVWKNVFEADSGRRNGRKSGAYTRVREYSVRKYFETDFDTPEPTQIVFPLPAKILVPPIKCQGIKTKIVPLILANVSVPKEGLWIEPFMGSGVVGMNARPPRGVFADITPHIISFYEAIKSKSVTPESARAFLEQEGQLLRERGEQHYYAVRERFNKEGDPFDFLFLSRSCFNGMMRFNKKGGFNVPFCRKPERFAAPYVTKIVNQIARFSELVHLHDWTFKNQDFEETISSATESDFIYCDPPYLGRHADYFNSWDAADEERLFRCLSETKARFILSTWHSNKYRKNEYLDSLWSRFHLVTKEHFYHVGAKEDNRNSMLEALVMNFHPQCEEIDKIATPQPSPFDPQNIPGTEIKPMAEGGAHGGLSFVDT